MIGSSMKQVGRGWVMKRGKWQRQVRQTVVEDNEDDKRSPPLLAPIIADAGIRHRDSRGGVGRWWDGGGGFTPVNPQSTPGNPTKGTNPQERNKSPRRSSGLKNKNPAKCGPFGED